ncbi:MAG: hypothetical protein LBR25_04250 [Erysipelotrichaceae bacterium]|jgi:hypothetical protein|nr:hypothetical protein [Erysipelotrichaceae bacterium]
MKKILVLLLFVLAGCSPKAAKEMVCQDGIFQMHFVGERPLEQVYISVDYTEEEMADYGFIITDKASFEKVKADMESYFTVENMETIITYEDSLIHIRLNYDMDAFIRDIGYSASATQITFAEIEDWANESGVACKVE